MNHQISDDRVHKPAVPATNEVGVPEDSDVRSDVRRIIDDLAATWQLAIKEAASKSRRDTQLESDRLQRDAELESERLRLQVEIERFKMRGKAMTDAIALIIDHKQALLEQRKNASGSMIEALDHLIEQCAAQELRVLVALGVPAEIAQIAVKPPTEEEDEAIPAKPLNKLPVRRASPVVNGRAIP